MGGREGAQKKGSGNRNPFLILYFLFFIPHLHGRQLHFLLQFHHTFPECAIRIHQIFDRLAGMDNCRMIPASKMLPDGFERVLGKCLCEIHGDLAGLYYFSFAGFLQKFIIWNIEVFAYHFLYGLDGNLFTTGFHKIPENSFSQIKINFPLI